MGERKVLNKYIPPDFDPSKIPRSKNARGAKNGQIKVRMMLPMTICCNTCGEFITKGTKFNARKEDVAGEDYLGIRIFRFYFRCTRCSAELAMKTDPKNSDYVVEAGASRNYEMWKDTTEDDEAKAKALDEAGNEMRALENRTEESKREMDIMAALDEMRSLNARHAGISNADALRAMASAAKTEDELAAQRDAATARAIFNEQRSIFVKRIESEGSDGSDDGGASAAKKQRVEDAPVVVVKRPAATVKVKPKPPPTSSSPPPSTGIGSMLGDYGSDSQS